MQRHWLLEKEGQKKERQKQKLQVKKAAVRFQLSAIGTLDSLDQVLSKPPTFTKRQRSEKHKKKEKKKHKKRWPSACPVFTKPQPNFGRWPFPFFFAPGERVALAAPPAVRKRRSPCHQLKQHFHNVMNWPSGPSGLSGLGLQLIIWGKHTHCMMLFAQTKKHKRKKPGTYTYSIDSIIFLSLCHLFAGVCRASYWMLLDALRSSSGDSIKSSKSKSSSSGCVMEEPAHTEPVPQQVRSKRTTQGTSVRRLVYRVCCAALLMFHHISFFISLCHDIPTTAQTSSSRDSEAGQQQSRH